LIPPIQKRLDDFRTQSRVRAGSLIVSVFSDAVFPRGGRVWLGSLITLLAPLDLSERLIRTSVFRLAKEDWLCAEAHGRRADYMLTPSGLRRFEEASRHVYAAEAPLWDRRWRLILTVGEVDAKQRESLRRSLFWQGFGLIGADCFVHPSTDVSSAFDALIAEGMTDLISHLMPLLAADLPIDLSAGDLDMVRRAWNLEKLATAYSDFVDCYQPSLDTLRHDAQSEVDDESAFLLRTLLINDYRRLLLRDPELPEVLLPAQWPGQKARQLCKELYRRLLPPSERYLDQHLELANGETPTASPSILSGRFQNPDPLATPV